MRLRSRIKNQSVSTGISAQALLQGFMLERLLDRLSRSDVRARLVLKGGVLLMGLLGFRRRTTMDLDATLRGVPLTEENVLRLLREVCSVSLPDRTSFAVLGAGPIRKDDRYGGFRVRILATYETIKTPIAVDVSTGDAITPGPVEHVLRGLFDDGAEYRVLAIPSKRSSRRKPNRSSPSANSEPVRATGTTSTRSFRPFRSTVRSSPPRFPPPPRIAEPKRPSPTPRAFSKRFPTAPSSVANGSSTATGSLTPRTSRSMPRSLRCGSCCFRLDEIMKGRRVSPAAFPFVWSLSLTRGGA